MRTKRLVTIVVATALVIGAVAVHVRAVSADATTEPGAARVHERRVRETDYRGGVADHRGGD